MSTRKPVDESLDEDVISESFQRLGLNQQAVPPPSTLHNYLLLKRLEQETSAATTQEQPSHHNTTAAGAEDVNLSHHRSHATQSHSSAVSSVKDDEEAEEEGEAVFGNKDLKYTYPKPWGGPSTGLRGGNYASGGSTSDPASLGSTQRFADPVGASASAATGLFGNDPRESSGGVESLYLQRKKLQHQREVEERANRQFLRDIRDLKAKMEGPPRPFEDETFSSRQQQRYPRRTTAGLNDSEESEESVEEGAGTVPQWRRAEALAFERKRKELLLEYGQLTKTERQIRTEYGHYGLLENFEPPPDADRFACRKLAWNRYEKRASSSNSRSSGLRTYHPSPAEVSQKYNATATTMLQTGNVTGMRSPKFESTGRYVALQDIQREERENRIRNEARRQGFVNSTGHFTMSPISKKSAGASRSDADRAARNRKIQAQWAKQEKAAARRGKDAIWEYRVANEGVGNRTRM